MNTQLRHLTRRLAVSAMVAVVVSLLAAGAGIAATTTGGWTIVHAGWLLAVPGSAPATRQSVVIANGRVVRVADGFLSGADIAHPDAGIVDLSKAYVMPGFIDLHVHLSGQYGSGSKLDEVTQSDADVALVAAMYGRRTFDAGFTTVRDVGSRGRAIFALRDAIRKGVAVGPRIIAAGHMISATGGHGDIHGFREDVLGLFKTSAICDGADDCRRAVRAEIKRGADVIKVAVTGGVLDESSAGTGQQFTDDELKAIVETAHALGRKVTGHAHAAAGIEAALRAGFDSIDHAMWADRDTMKLFRKTGAWLIPTIYPITAVGDTPEKMKKGPFKDMPPAIMAKLLKLGKQPKIMARLAYKMGVKIALGTDAGVYHHGENAHEFLEYVNIGMSPMEALMAGTVNAAKAAGWSDRIGSLEPGKYADLVALPGNPLDDINQVLNVIFVMRDGQVFKSPER